MSIDRSEYSPFETAPIVRAGYTIIGLAVVGLLVWASLAPLASAVVVAGQLTPEGNRKTIQHLEGGIIKAIRVNEGDAVRAGDVLMQLESESGQTHLNTIRSHMDSLTATQARLAAEERETKSIDFPRELIDRQVEPEVDELLRGQERIFRSRLEARHQKLVALNGEIQQLKEQISGLDAQHASATAQLAIIEDELKGLRRLYQEGFGWQSRMRAFDRESEKLKGDAAKALTDKAAAHARIQQIDAELAKTEQEFREQTATQRQDIVQQIREAEQQLRAAADSVRRLEVVAPYAGRVLNLRKHSIAGVVAPGEALMDVVPMDEQLIADVKVSPQDVDQVQAGQRAEVLFPSLNLRQTPKFAGQVVLVSADRLLEATTNQPYYLARVKIVEGQAEKLGQLTLKPGLPVEVHIQTGSRTALSYLLKPLTDQFRRGMRDT